MRVQGHSLHAVVTGVGPVRLVFIASLLLSFVAISNGLVNRDGILYLDIAHSILNDGLGKAGGTFNWPFFPTLIAGLAALTRLDPETAAYVLNSLLMAGTCSLLVAITRRRNPDAVWLACLVVLAIPGYNQYRGQILREYGLWFFSVLSVWLALRWEETPRWREAILCQMSVAVAALFRLEAVMIYPALIAWQLFSAPEGTRVRRTLMIGCLPLAGILGVMLVFGSGLARVPERVAYYLDAANPVHKLEMFKDAGRRLYESGVFKYKYSREEAGQVLFFGLLALIPIKFLKMLGVLVVPFLYVLVARTKFALTRWLPMTWMFVSYVGVLMVFVTHELFLSARYVSMLNLLVVPVVAAGLTVMMARFSRWRGVLVALAVLSMASNVISLAPKKTPIVAAGKWLGANVADNARIYIDNPRIAYYAGWHALTRRWNEPLKLEALSAAVANGRFDYVVLESGGESTEITNWIAANHLQVLQRFAVKGNIVFIIGKSS